MTSPRWKSHHTGKFPPQRVRPTRSWQSSAYASTQLPFLQVPKRMPQSKRRAILVSACGTGTMPKIDVSSVSLDLSSGYPPPFDIAVKGRARKRLGRAAGLTQFGVNICTLKSGAASSHRHWHENEDEFVYMLSGEAVLVEDGEETVLKAGDAAAWKAGIPNGHCLINRSDGDAVFIEVGTRAASERAHYPDVDLKAERDGSQARYTGRDGTPY